MISNHNKRRTRPSASSSRVVEDDISTRLFKLEDDREKEDEELDLEASLFGKKRKRAARGSRGSGIGKSKAKAEQEEMGGEDMGMPGVFWEDKGDDVGMSSGGNADEMFYEDAPLAEDREDEDEQEEEEIDFEQDLEADSEVSASDRDDVEDEETSDSDSNSEADVDAEPTTTPSWLSTPSSSKPKSKKPLWQDPSDNQISLDMSKDNRLRKLVRSQPGSSTVDGQGLESKLREQFEKMHPQPEWATEAKSRAAKQKNMKNKNKTQKLDPLQALFASTASFLDTSSTSLSNRGLLPKGALEVRRLRDANYQNRTVWEGGNGKKKVVGEKGKKEEEGKKAKYMDTGMMDVKFHPKVEVLAAVGADRRLRLFNIDGHTNSSLLSLHIPSLPIKNMQFHPSGTSLLLTGSRPFYYTYDLRSQRCIRSPKNLLSNASASDPGSTYSMEKTVFSPDGSVLAVAGKRGIVTLLAWGPGGSGQVLTTLRSGRTGGVQDMMWRKGGKELWVLGEGSEVDVWDLGERRCVARWKDQGGFGGRLLKGSRNGDYCAVASTTGVVNVYDANEITSSVNTSIDASEGLFAGASPRPIRELMNLTTEITNIAFNHDAQMMAVSSSKKKDAFRMFHLPSATAFTNWPTSSTPLGVVTCSDFSAGSEYVAMGNTRGKILLYSVEHYKPLGA